MTLEGPYGRFDFAAGRSASQPQVWIAGGIGITPFVARLQALAAMPGEQRPTVDLFYAARSAQAFPENLPALCAAAGVRLHRRATDCQKTFTPDDVAACLPAGGSVWFCGPAGWGDELARHLGAAGLPGRAFHRECFEFR